MKKKPFISVIIAAGGSGSRMGQEVNKIFLEYGGKPILAHTLSVFENCPLVDEVIIVTAEKDIVGCRDVCREFAIKKVTVITVGGKERQHSVQNGLSELSPECELVLVHDAARSLLKEETLTALIDDVINYGAAAPGVPCKNTIKVADKEGFIVDTPDRKTLYEIQTPQGFRRDIIESAYQNASEKGILGTDDCFLAEQMGVTVKITPGDYTNIKITTPEDLSIAEELFALNL